MSLHCLGTLQFCINKTAAYSSWGEQGKSSENKQTFFFFESIVLSNSEQQWLFSTCIQRKLKVQDDNNPLAVLISCIKINCVQIGEIRQHSIDP